MDNNQVDGGFPGMADLRAWDMTLLQRYQPQYHVVNRSCTLCALGPCDLGKGRRGACGQDQETFMAREALLIAVTGAAAHAAHARDIVQRLMSEKGADMAIDLGDWVQIRMPITQVVTGTSPWQLKDLLPVLEYIDTQIVKLLASAHFGGESHTLDLESKTLHAGTMDILSMEIADVAQISGYCFPKGVAETPLIPIGISALSRNKPLILCIGHHSDVGHRIIDMIDKAGLDADIEVAGLCCTSHDMVRGYISQNRSGVDDDPIKGYSSGPKIIGNLRDQLRFIRTGRADVVVADQQCVRLDLLSEAMCTGAFFISTSEQSCAGLPDETGNDPLELASELIKRPLRAVFISEPDRAANLSVMLAKRYKRIAGPVNISSMYSIRKGKQQDAVVTQENPIKIWESAKDCTDCGLCTKHCPIALPVAERIFSLGKSLSDSAGDQTVTAISELYRQCIACGKCDSACPQQIPVMAVIGSSVAIPQNIGWMRAGRGPVDDYEIKNTGPSIVLGDIPGVIAFLTCPEYPDSRDSLLWMARMLAERGYIVLAAGCAAMDLGIDNDEGMLYHNFPGTFEMGSIINTGSCVSSAHAIGALIKVASIFLHRNLDGNYAEIADYILNRIGAAGILWGGITPKSFAASAGANRLGIPVIFGPQGYKFRRTLEGKSERGYVFDARSGEKVTSGLAPSHLCIVSKTKEEAIVEVARLCIRPNDTTWGRQTKLRNYIELSETLLGVMPCDLPGFVRVADDLPKERRSDLMDMLSTTGWQQSFIPDPTLIKGLVRSANKAC